MAFMASALYNKSTNLSSINETKAAIGNAANDTLAFGIFVEFIFLWTIIGNIIIISVLKLYKPLTIPDILVFSLALSDLLNVLLPSQILNLIQSKLIRATWNKSNCIAFTWSVHCLRLASVLTVSVIAMDRLIAVQKPLFYRARVMHEINRVKVLILLLWLFSCFVASLPYIGQAKSPFRDTECHYQLYDLGRTYGFFVEILGLLQLVLVLYCYIAIRISTWHFMQRQGKFRRPQLERVTSNPDDSTKEQAKRAVTKVNTERHLPHKTLTESNSKRNVQGNPANESKTKVGSFVKHLGSKKKENGVPLLTEGMKQVAKLEKMMAVLVLLFYISWIPFLGSNLFSLVTGKSNQNVIRIIGVFSLINGFLNPIVYATIYPRYKKGYIFVFQTILRCCGRKKPTSTTADFDSSKIGRSRRLRTLRELKSNASLSSTATLREAEPQYLRDGRRTEVQERVILEEVPQDIPLAVLQNQANNSSKSPDMGYIGSEFEDRNGNAIGEDRVLSARGVHIADCFERDKDEQAFSKQCSVDKSTEDGSICSTNPNRGHGTEPRNDTSSFVLPSSALSTTKSSMITNTTMQTGPGANTSSAKLLLTNLDMHYHNIDDSLSVVNGHSKQNTPYQLREKNSPKHPTGIENRSFSQELTCSVEQETE